MTAVGDRKREIAASRVSFRNDHQCSPLPHLAMTIDSASLTFYYDRSSWGESAAEAADYQEEGADWRGEGFRGGRHSSPRVSYYFPKGVGDYHFGVSCFYAVFARRDGR
jgi:hypothetical protein